MKRKQFEKYHAAAAEEQAAIERNPYTIFHQALKNCEPVIGLVPILKGGHFYQVRAGKHICPHVRQDGGRAQTDSFLGTGTVRICLSESHSAQTHRQKVEKRAKKHPKGLSWNPAPPSGILCSKL